MVASPDGKPELGRDGAAGSFMRCNRSFTDAAVQWGMWHPWVSSRPSADTLALRNNAERAGCALACSFGSSDEFEAAVIRSRLDAGVYGPKRRRRSMAYAGAAIGALIALVLII
jgi:hypothetical protein